MQRINRLPVFGIAVLLALLLFPAGASAQQGPSWLDGTPRARLLLLLHSIDQGPGEKALEELGAELDVAAELVAIAEDVELAQLPRGRAISTLTRYPSAETRALAERLLATEADGNLFLLGRTLRLVRYGFAESEPEWALAVIAPFVGHDDAVVRELVVQNLAVLRQTVVAPRTDDLILQLVIAERNPAVKAALETALHTTTELRPSKSEPIRRQ